MDALTSEEVAQAEAFEQQMQSGWFMEKRHEFRRIPPEEVFNRVETRQFQESDLSEDQKVVYKELVKWVDEYVHTTCDKTPVLTMGGYAGTGKSTLISVLAHKYKDLCIAFCAFTGKASNVLKQKLAAAGVRLGSASGNIHRVSTIHSLIYKPVIVNGVPVRFDKLSDLGVDLIVVDEASMVDEKIFEDLRSYNIPILAVGDHGQLAPIGSKFNLMQAPQLRLEKIHRQAEGNPIIRLSAYIRENGFLPDKYDNSEHVQFLNPDFFRKRMEDVYSHVTSHEHLANIGTLCYTNKKRRMANNLVRELRFGVGENEPPKEGDQIICLKNQYNLIFNGMRGYVLNSIDMGQHWYKTHILFNEDDLEMKGILSKYQFNRDKTINAYEDIQHYGIENHKWWDTMGLLFDYGYCLTVHKSQGSSFKDTFVLYERPYNVDADEFRRWMYTAVTRASERLTMVIR